MSDLPSLFETTFEEAFMLGTTWTLTSALGPITIHDAALLEDTRVLNWPSTTLNHVASHPRFSIAATPPRPRVIDMIAALPAERMRVSTFRERGAFPVRWWPSRIAGLWVAQYIKSGHAVLRDGNRILFVAGSQVDTSRHVQRVLREVLIHGGLREGFVLAHSAVVSRGERAVLVIGSTGAGKTDLAIKLAHNLRGSLVSVDRCLLAVRNGRVVASALPFGLNIHRGTLTDLGHAADDLIRCFPPKRGKHYLDVDSFERLCGIPITVQAKVVACLSLRPPSDVEHITPLPERDLPTVFFQVAAGGRDPGFQLDWLGLGPQAPPSPLEPQQWAATLPGAGLSVRYRPGSPITLPALTEWVAKRLEAHP